MNVDSRDGQYKLMCSVVYVLVGLAVLSMSLNLIQEEVVDFAIKVAKDCGCIDDEDDEEDEQMAPWSLRCSNTNQRSYPII